MMIIVIKELQRDYCCALTINIPVTVLIIRMKLSLELFFTFCSKSIPNLTTCLKTKSSHWKNGKPLVKI